MDFMDPIVGDVLLGLGHHKSALRPFCQSMAHMYRSVSAILS